MKRFAGLLLLLAVAGCGSSSSPTTPAPASTPTAAPLPTPTPAPTPIPNRPPTLIVKVHPDPPHGRAPVAVRWNLCTSTDPEGDRLVFFVDFGDGTEVQRSCRHDHTYRRGHYTAKMCIWDGRSEHSVDCQEYGVRAD